ncbi:MAG: Rrf2 family transcriptional regulator [Chitinispirillaceae bacterium]|jgi:Rrf2 family protein|nr:Rrf2 family transcriptional regulator [Chitinispirillaceae bacterium]
MKLSTKSRYGLRAILEIARSHGQKPSQRKDIAKKEDISSSYLENILLLLRNSKILATMRGIHGGYILTRPPSEITVYDVIRALEGPITIVDCVGNPGKCDESTGCTSRVVWCAVADAIRTTLEGITLQNMLDKEKEHGASNYSI